MKQKLFILLLNVVLCASLFVTAAVAERIAPEAAKAKVEAGALLVDVRSPREFNSGHVQGAINVPHEEASDRLAEFGEDKTRAIVLYCGSGRRAGIAEQALKTSGFTQVFNAGGYKDWPKN